MTSRRVFMFSILAPLVMMCQCPRGGQIGARPGWEGEGPSILFFYELNNRDCYRMEQELWQSPQVQRTLTEFPYRRERIDVGTPDGQRWAEQYGVRSTPTCLVIGCNGDVKGWLEGYRTPDQFVRWLIDVTDKNYYGREERQ